MPQTHPKFSRSSEEFVAEAYGYLRKLNPALQMGDLKASRTKSQLQASSFLLKQHVADLKPGESGAFRGLGSVLGLASAYSGVKKPFSSGS